MYAPTKNLLDGVRAAFPKQLFPWDEYFPQMAETDWLCGDGDTIAAKSFFIRQAPFGGSYAVLGGITAALAGISDLHFNDPEFKKGMLDMGYIPEFVDWLEEKGSLRLLVYAPREGDLIFPNEPAVTVVGPLPDVRMAEGILTEALNFPTLSLTKWYRLVRTVRPGKVLEFARRRAQNHAKATLYGILGGCFATSNSAMKEFFDFLLVGTMGHEWIQRYGDVREAFKKWLDKKPHKPIGLVDTKQCLEHDFPIWLDEVWNHREAIKNANSPSWGWRNDSGHLDYLTIEQYVKFFKHSLSKDEWFSQRMKIVLTNELDEYRAADIISKIRKQAGSAGLDAEDIIRRIIWAAGTKPGTCDDQPSLGGVAKLMEVEAHACIKLAFDEEGKPGDKTSIPGFNLSALILDEYGDVKNCLIYPAASHKVEGGKLWDAKKNIELREAMAYSPANEAALMIVRNYRAIPRQQLVWDSLTSRYPYGFTGDWDNPTVDEIPKRVQANVDMLHWSMTQLSEPYKLKVSLTKDLFELRQRMILNGVLREDKQKF